MRICHVSRSLCPRMVKLAWVQRESGIDTYWIGERSPSFQRTFPFTQMKIGQEARFGGLSLLIKAMNSKVDAFHVHTHISDTKILEEVLNHAKRPVIWDCHDKPDVKPKNAPKSSLGPVYELTGEHGAVYRTYCPKEWFDSSDTKLYKIVIATGLSDAKGHFRYWLDTFKKLKEKNFPVVCFTSSIIPDEYREVADMRGPIDVTELIGIMRHANVGLCGSPNPDENMKSAHPNKLYEYIAAGIPVICLGRDHDMANIIRDRKLGIAIDSIEDIDYAFEYIEENKIKENVLEVRNSFTMESQLEIVNQFYEQYL